MPEREQVYRRQSTGLHNCCTSPEIVIAVVGIAPIHEQLAAEPEHARDAANRATRASAERPILKIQMLAVLRPVMELQNQAFGKSDRVDVVSLEIISRPILQLFVGLNPISHPDGVGRRVDSDGGDCVQVVGILPALAVEALLTLGVDLLVGQPLGEHDQPAEAFLASRDFDLGDPEFNAEVLLVELTPTAKLGLGIRADNLFLAEVRVVLDLLEVGNDLFEVALPLNDQLADTGPKLEQPGHQRFSLTGFNSHTTFLSTRD